MIVDRSCYLTTIYQLQQIGRDHPGSLMDAGAASNGLHPPRSTQPLYPRGSRLGHNWWIR